MPYLTGMIKFGATSATVTTALIDPKDFSVDIQDIDKSLKRNSKGNIERKYTTTKRVLNCSWGYLTQTESSTLLTTLNSATNKTFWLNYPDPQLGYTTKQFYVSKKSVPMYKMQNSGSTLVGFWEGVDIEFTEV